MLNVAHREDEEDLEAATTSLAVAKEISVAVLLEP